MKRCPCKGSFLDKFIQPAILTILHRKSSYGFRLLEELKEENLIADNTLDPAGFYRTLKRMEAAGLISSHWDVENHGKPRRIFDITPAGRECLINWHTTLIQYREDIDVIIAAVGASVSGLKPAAEGEAVCLCRETPPAQG